MGVPKTTRVAGREKKKDVMWSYEDRKGEEIVYRKELQIMKKLAGQYIFQYRLAGREVEEEKRQLKK